MKQKDRAEVLTHLNDAVKNLLYSQTPNRKTENAKLREAARHTREALDLLEQGIAETEMEEK